MSNVISREMLEFLVMISRYLMALCMGFYTLDCFWAFKYREESTGGILYIRQNFWMFIIQFLGFYNLAYISKEWAYVILYIALQLFCCNYVVELLLETTLSQNSHILLYLVISHYKESTHYHIPLLLPARFLCISILLCSIPNLHQFSQLCECSQMIL
mgnify:CR=1 FL=1